MLDRSDVLAVIGKLVAAAAAMTEHVTVDEEPEPTECAVCSHEAFRAPATLLRSGSVEERELAVSYEVNQ